MICADGGFALRAQNGSIPETSDMTLFLLPIRRRPRRQATLYPHLPSLRHRGRRQHRADLRKRLTGTDPMPPAINHLTGSLTGDDGNHRPTMVLSTTSRSRPQSLALTFFEVEAEAGISSRLRCTTTRRIFRRLAPCARRVRPWSISRWG